LICSPVILTCVSESGHPQAGIFNTTTLSAASAGWIAAKMKTTPNAIASENNVFRLMHNLLAFLFTMDFKDLFPQVQ
jgi:hypothetical protein